MHVILIKLNTFYSIGKQPSYGMINVLLTIFVDLNIISKQFINENFLFLQVVWLVLLLQYGQDEITNAPLFVSLQMLSRSIITILSLYL